MELMLCKDSSVTFFSHIGKRFFDISQRFLSWNLVEESFALMQYTLQQIYRIIETEILL